MRLPSDVLPWTANRGRLRRGFGGGLRGNAGEGARISRRVGSSAPPRPR